MPRLLCLVLLPRQGPTVPGPDPSRWADEVPSARVMRIDREGHAWQPPSGEHVPRWFWKPMQQRSAYGPTFGILTWLALEMNFGKHVGLVGRGLHLSHTPRG